MYSSDSYFKLMILYHVIHNMPLIKCKSQVSNLYLRVGTYV